MRNLQSIMMQSDVLHVSHLAINSFNYFRQEPIDSMYIECSCNYGEPLLIIKWVALTAVDMHFQMPVSCFMNNHVIIKSSSISTMLVTLCATIVEGFECICKPILLKIQLITYSLQWIMSSFLFHTSPCITLGHFIWSHFKLLTKVTAIATNYWSIKEFRARNSYWPISAWSV